MSTDPIQWSAASVVAAAGAGTTGLGGGLAPEDVSPGVIGFLVTLALVLACIPLFRSMTGKLRGVQHRDRAAETAEGTAEDTVPGAGGAGSGDDGAVGDEVSVADEERLGRDAGAGSGPDAG